MGRAFKEESAEVIEKIIERSLNIIGAEFNEGQTKLFLRLIISGIANHYFHNPDDIINVGFLRFEKSPDKNELFKVTIIKNQEVGVVNAETLWEYYNGELKQKQQLKEVLNDFLKELISYSQAQEIDITNLTNSIERKKRRN